ncbi:MAG: hypothetical protein KDD48_01905 [Bdellovibrionales bacterium]|nr:hypothetical protein [Bdellovibrionales bacterium]
MKRRRVKVLSSLAGLIICLLWRSTVVLAQTDFVCELQVHKNIISRSYQNTNNENDDTFTMESKRSYSGSCPFGVTYPHGDPCSINSNFFDYTYDANPTGNSKVKSDITRLNISELQEVFMTDSNSSLLLSVPVSEVNKKYLHWTREEVADRTACLNLGLDRAMNLHPPFFLQIDFGYKEWDNQLVMLEHYTIDRKTPDSDLEKFMNNKSVEEERFIDVRKADVQMCIIHAKRVAINPMDSRNDWFYYFTETRDSCRQDATRIGKIYQDIWNPGKLIQKGETAEGNVYLGGAIKVYYYYRQDNQELNVDEDQVLEFQYPEPETDD